MPRQTSTRAGDDERDLGLDPLGDRAGVADEHQHRERAERGEGRELRQVEHLGAEREQRRHHDRGAQRPPGRAQPGVVGAKPGQLCGHTTKPRIRAGAATIRSGAAQTSAGAFECRVTSTPGDPVYPQGAAHAKRSCVHIWYTLPMRFAILLVPVLALILLAGCSGSGDHSAATPSVYRGADGSRDDIGVSHPYAVADRDQSPADRRGSEARRGPAHPGPALHYRRQRWSDCLRRLLLPSSRLEHRHHQREPAQGHQRPNLHRLPAVHPRDRCACAQRVATRRARD